MADHYGDKFFPPSYFPAGYFQGGEQNPGAMSASLSGSADVAATLDFTIVSADRGGDGFPRSSAIRQRRRARSLKRNLAYLEAIETGTPVIERVVSKAIAREAVAKAEAVGLVPDDMPPQWVPNIVTVPVADVNDKALAVAAVIRELARRAAEDEEDVEMLLLAA